MMATGERKGDYVKNVRKYKSFAPNHWAEERLPEDAVAKECRTWEGHGKEGRVFAIYDGGYGTWKGDVDGTIVLGVTHWRKKTPAGRRCGVKRIEEKKAPYDLADFMPPWPCQQLHGGRPPYIYQGVDEYGWCRHPLCSPANDDRVRMPGPEGGAE